MRRSQPAGHLHFASDCRRDARKGVEPGRTREGDGFGWFGWWVWRSWRCVCLNCFSTFSGFEKSTPVDQGGLCAPTPVSPGHLQAPVFPTALSSKRRDRQATGGGSSCLGVGCRGLGDCFLLPRRTSTASSGRRKKDNKGSIVKTKRGVRCKGSPGTSEGIESGSLLFRFPAAIWCNEVRPSPANGLHHAQPGASLAADDSRYRLSSCGPPLVIESIFTTHMSATSLRELTIKIHLFTSKQFLYIIRMSPLHL